MDSRQAVIDFANLLTIGSSALKGIIRAVDPAARETVESYLAEVDAIGARLDEIGRALEELVATPR